MENKYYTPKIEEFRVGFECETNYCLFHSSKKDHQEFEKLIITEDNITLMLDSYIGDAYPSEFRVKYLDKSDIEELGFICEINSEKYLSFFKDDLWLQLTTISNVTKLAIKDQETFLFIGIIKNKSELKELLEKIGVSYNS